MNTQTVDTSLVMATKAAAVETMERSTDTYIAVVITDEERAGASRTWTTKHPATGKTLTVSLQVTEMDESGIRII